MKNITSLCCFAVLCSALNAQTCLPGGINFTSQAEINAFSTNYPGCTHILGDVQIHESTPGDITNFAGLSSVTTIDGYILIYDNDALTNFSGLESLSYLGGILAISGNASLSSLTGLDALTYIGSDIEIDFCPSLVNLQGLEALTALGGHLYLVSNAGLTNLSGLNGITWIGGYLDVSNNAAITSLEGLNGVTSIGGYLDISNNPALTSLSALSSVTSIGGYLEISNNDALTSLAGLDNIDATTIEDFLAIEASDMLSVCDVQSICNYLAIPSNGAYIAGNALGCNSIAEVEEACLTLDDTDGDGIPDEFDNCINTPNPLQADDDCDGVGNACDRCPGGDDRIDADGDGNPDCAVYPGFDYLPTAWTCSNNANSDKVLMCHHPENEPWNTQTICVSENAVQTHLNHGDYIGTCDNALCGGNNFSKQPGQSLTTAQTSICLKLFPNPTESNIKLDFEEAIPEKTTVLVVDLAGQIINKEPLSPGEWEQSVSTGRLPSGIYFIKVALDERPVWVCKLIKL